jgi:hypothetical protein
MVAINVISSIREDIVDEIINEETCGAEKCAEIRMMIQGIIFEKRYSTIWVNSRIDGELSNNLFIDLGFLHIYDELLEH